MASRCPAMHAQGLASHRAMPGDSAPIGACYVEAGECSSRCGRQNRRDTLTPWGVSMPDVLSCILGLVACVVVASAYLDAMEG